MIHNMAQYSTFQFLKFGFLSVRHGVRIIDKRLLKILFKPYNEEESKNSKILLDDKICARCTLRHYTCTMKQNAIGYVTQRKVRGIHQQSVLLRLNTTSIYIH